MRLFRKRKKFGNFRDGTAPPDIVYQLGAEAAAAHVVFEPMPPSTDFTDFDDQTEWIANDVDAQRAGSPLNFFHPQSLNSRGRERLRRNGSADFLQRMDSPEHFHQMRPCSPERFGAGAPAYYRDQIRAGSPAQFRRARAGSPEHFHQMRAGSPEHFRAGSPAFYQEHMRPGSPAQFRRAMADSPEHFHQRQQRVGSPFGFLKQPKVVPPEYFQQSDRKPGLFAQLQELISGKTYAEDPGIMYQQEFDQNFVPNYHDPYGMKMNRYQNKMMNQQYPFGY